MFKYIQGKFASGLPNSVINSYINFYTSEERHIFLPGSKVTRTYRIQTQPGSMTMGYAVEACWEPPTVNPVHNPATDFPTSANQSEPYVERYFLNDDKPITLPSTEIKEYPIYVQYREWPSNEPNNSTARYVPMSYVGGKWHFPYSELGGTYDGWRVGPVSGTDDVYQVVFDPSVNFKPFGQYNGYYVYLRFSWWQDAPGGADLGNPANFNPSIHVVQVAIPGNDP
jgi:hypothetical protein